MRALEQGHGLGIYSFAAILRLGVPTTHGLSLKSGSLEAEPETESCSSDLLGECSQGQGHGGSQMEQGEICKTVALVGDSLQSHSPVSMRAGA